MSAPARAQRLSSPALAWAGGAVALLIAIGLFSRYGIDGNLSRDESIYAYGGQQLADGVAPYASIFDPKTPLASMLAGVGVLVAKALGTNDVDAIRIAFLVFACLTVVAVYGLAFRLWESPLAALVAAVVFTSFRGFAIDALGGPDAKTPGIFLGILSMALLLRRRWFWGAFAGSLAFLVWQPLAIYAALAVAGAALGSEPGERWRQSARAAAGAAIPAAATTLYLWLAGALPEFVESAFVFPATGIRRPPETLPERFTHIADVVDAGYGRTRVLFWGGLLLLLALAVARLARGRSAPRAALADPFLWVVVASFAGIAAYSIADFQGYPDLYPLLPYAALGLGGAVAATDAGLRRPRLRLASRAGAAVATVALVALCWSWYSGDHPRSPGLVAQRAQAAVVERIAGPGRAVYALGSPVPLVLTHRRNPDRYIYLSSGVGRWKVEHTRGGLAGWERQIRAARPAAIVVGDLHSDALLRLMARLRSSYRVGHLGTWIVFVDPALRERARRGGIAVS